MKKMLRLMVLSGAMVALGSPCALADLRESAGKRAAADPVGSASTTDVDKNERKPGFVMKWMLKDYRVGSCRQAPRSAPNTGSWQARGESAMTFCKP